MRLYRLDKTGRPILESNAAAWEKWIATADRHVGYEKVGESWVSTIFLAMWLDDETERPELWQVLVRGGKLSGKKISCAGDWDQALAMHKAMVQRVKDALRPGD